MLFIIIFGTLFFLILPANEIAFAAFHSPTNGRRTASIVEHFDLTAKEATQKSRSGIEVETASARSGLRLRRSVVLTIKTNGLEREFNFDRATKSSELQYKTNPR